MRSKSPLQVPFQDQEKTCFSMLHFLNIQTIQIIRLTNTCISYMTHTFHFVSSERRNHPSIFFSHRDIFFHPGIDKMSSLDRVSCFVWVLGRERSKPETRRPKTICWFQLSEREPEPESRTACRIRCHSPGGRDTATLPPCVGL